MNRPELLAPAGNMEKLRIAVSYGADAVYLSGKSFGLRSYADNFTDDELKEAFDFLRGKNKKGYVTVNIFAHNDDIERIPYHLEILKKIGVHGLIISDFGIFELAREIAPEIPIHVSTQANSTNHRTVNFWKGIGAVRVNLARELTPYEMKEIREKTTVELEVFVHGAMCIAYSGRCIMSAILTERSGNRGECTHPCRWNYNLVEEKRPGEFFPVFEDDSGSYVYNSKDLCLITHIPELIAMGIDSFKIEGRMKGINYLATVSSVYRRVIDEYLEKGADFHLKPEWLEELYKISNRGYTKGFFGGRDGETVSREKDYERRYEFKGVIKELREDFAVVEARNRIAKGESVEFFDKSLSPCNYLFEEMLDKNGDNLDFVNPNRIFMIKREPFFTENGLFRKQIISNPRKGKDGNEE